VPKDADFDPKREFLAQLPLIESVIAFVVRKHHLSATDAEDFDSHVKLRFVENDYAILRKFRGDSLLRTFLATVVSHLCLDFQTAAWGKWRPSAAARRAGPVAVQLEKLLTRDNLTFDEACATLGTNQGVTLSRRELDALAGTLPARTRRKFESEEELQKLPSPERLPDQVVADREDMTVGRHAQSIMVRLMAELQPIERLILMMKFRDGRTLSDIARQLHLPQKPLYRRLEGILTQLRSSFEAEGLDAATVLPLLENWIPDLGWNSSRESATLGPSKNVGATSGNTHG
jgi:RNA polymerase sigma factor (sigma-70 family)